LLFTYLFKIFSKDLKRDADNALSKPNRALAYNVVKSILPDTITNKWDDQRHCDGKLGITALSNISCWCHSRLAESLVILPSTVNSKRQGESVGREHSNPAREDSTDTPEGAYGLVKNLALLGHITADEDIQPIERLCRDLGVEEVNRLTGHEINSLQAYLVLLNGLILGVHTRPKELMSNLKSMRRLGLAGEFVSLYLHEGQRAVHVQFTSRRMVAECVVL
jgi:DNA-directed RNA polymerase III subunit RPC2